VGYPQATLSVAVVHPAAIHPLTPGSPAYAALKVGTIGSIVALRFALTRRSRQQEQAAPADHSAAEPPAERQRSAHPVSRKKKKRRRRG
jgi:hypothetical protein